MTELKHIKRDSEQGIEDAVNLELARDKSARLMSITYNGNEYVAFLMADSEAEKRHSDYCSRLHCENCKYWQGEDGLLTGFCSEKMIKTRRDKKASTCKHFSDEAGEE